MGRQLLRAAAADDRGRHGIHPAAWSVCHGGRIGDLWGGASALRISLWNGRGTLAAMLVIPAIDLKDGRCVRLRQGDMAAETVYSDDAPAVARRWQQGGAAWSVCHGGRIGDLWGGASALRISLWNGRGTLAAMLVIPAIDLKDGRCVRLRQGDMAAETVYSDDAPAVARRWQ